MYGNDGRLPHRFSAPQHTCRARYAITPPSVRLTVTRLDQPTRSSATAEKQRVSCPHGGGGWALQPTVPIPLWLHLCVWSNPIENRNKRTSSVPSVKCTLSWIGHSRSFKVILIGAGRNPERYIVVMCN